MTPINPIQFKAFDYVIKVTNPIEINGMLDIEHYEKKGYNNFG